MEPDGPGRDQQPPPGGGRPVDPPYDEVLARLIAVDRLVVLALLGEIDVPTAAHGALEMLARAQSFLEEQQRL